MGTNGNIAGDDRMKLPQSPSIFSSEVSQLLSGRSALEPRVEDVVNGENGEALARMIDFMECRGCLHVLRFWLDSQHFSQLHLDSHRQNWDTGDDDGECVSEEPLDSGRQRSTTSPRLVRCSEISEKSLRIFSLYLAHGSSEMLCLDEDIRRQVLEGMCQEDGSVDLDCFAPAQKWAWSLITDRYFGQFVRSYQFLLYQSELVLSDRLTLADLCNSAHSLPYLLEFGQGGKSWFGDGLRFLLCALHYERSDKVDGTGSPDARQDASLIFERYITKNAPNPIPMDDLVRDKLEETIRRSEKEGVSCIVFREALTDIYARLARTCLGEFFRSEPFMRYLVHLDVCLKTAMTDSGVSISPSSSRDQKLSRWKSQEQCSEQVFWQSTKKEPPMETRSLSGVDRLGPSRGRAGTDRSVSVSAESDGEVSLSASVSDTNAHRPMKKMALGQVDLLGRFVSFAEAEPAGLADTPTLLQRLKKKSAQKRKEEEALAALEAQRIIEDTLQQLAPSHT